MIIKINIILGFLGSGKTNFINSLLKNAEFIDETIVIIQDEFGKCEINSQLNNLETNNKIVVIKNTDNEEININYIKKIIAEYSPSKIFIEANGMKDCTSIIDIFSNKNIKKSCKINSITTLIDAKNFLIFFKNMNNIMNNLIFNSETIILNNFDNLSKKDSFNIQKGIAQINETATIMKSATLLNENNISEDKYLILNKNFYTFKNLFFISILTFLITFIITLKISNPSTYNTYFDVFKNFYSIFISILIQGIPFILVGGFVSSLIQIYVSKDLFVKIFPKNILLSCIVASFSGLLFPICDCGTIPIVRSLLKKELPISVAITFMLSAPIVNPIAIISTIYAFPGMYSVVIYRVLAGIIISISVGLIIQLLTKKDKDIFKNTEYISTCNCTFCNTNSISSNNNFEKIKSLFIHTGDEFFNIGKFMIIGTFLSSIFQIISSTHNLYIPKDNISSLILMILLSFLLSVCSTSDAFIAKSFLKQFPISSVMGFLVVGPMLDVKNTLMLFGSFKKSFVIKLVSTIVIVSFIILANFSIL